MRCLHDALDRRVLLTDGSLSRRLRQQDLDVERDLWGAESCLEILNLTRAGMVRDLHEAYLRAGADVLRTHTLAASPLSLEAAGLADHAFYLNHAAAQLACESVDAVPGRGRRRFVLGLVRDQGWDTTPKEIEQAVALQVEGLLSGGVDGIALDITPGIGRGPIFLNGAARARQAVGARAPIFLQGGVDGTGFSDHARAQADGVIVYRPGAPSRGRWLQRAIREEGINLLGGGDTPEDTEELDRLLRLEAEDNLRPLNADLRARLGAIEESEPPSSLIRPDPILAELH
ncbi:homocysteine S-methyltransferase family protein [Fodinicurvata sediminis]|uniref:homocysteine S-methyltransferase family protein n=1 Tax=Fodinicurvata sediminis TaxID=1121832 RepID=UPI00040D0533|nr:homocysteine S-methyltransferase family protein [Fodinicurvata sediminis]